MLKVLNVCCAKSAIISFHILNLRPKAVRNFKICIPSLQKVRFLVTYDANSRYRFVSVHSINRMRGSVVGTVTMLCFELAGLHIPVLPGYVDRLSYSLDSGVLSWV